MRTQIRLCSNFQGDSDYCFEFDESWFYKFQPTLEVRNDEIEGIQLSILRDHFLQSTNLHDDVELEIILDLENRKMKLIKTRDLFIIDAHIPFEIDQ